MTGARGSAARAGVAWACSMALLTAPAPAAQKSPPTRSGPATSVSDPSDTFAREAVAAALTGDRDGLKAAFARAAGAEAAAGDTRALRPSDGIAYLFNSNLRSRDESLRGHERALAEARSEELRSSILQALLSDEYYELGLLKGENRFNKFTRLFNRASSAASRAVLLQPQAAAQLVVEGVYTARRGRVATDRERRMVYLARAFLAKHPAEPEAPEVAEFLAGLSAKLDADRARREAEAGRILLNAGRPVAAAFHLERATLLAPGDAATSQALVEARDAADVTTARLSAGLGVGDAEARMDPAIRAAAERMTRALVRGDGAAVAALAEGNTALRPAAAYALAALDERAGRHDAALARVKAVAGRPADPGAAAGAGQPFGAAAAAELAATDSFDPAAAYDRAKADFERRRTRYVMTGRRNADETAYAAADAAAGGIGALPALFFTDALVRGVSGRFRNAVDADELLDAGARWTRRRPGDPRAAEVRATARALMPADDGTGPAAGGQRALEAAAANDPARAVKDGETRAETLLKRAKATEDPGARRTRLDALLKDLPDTAAAPKARAELAKLPPTAGAGCLSLPRAVLSRDTALAASLGIDPAWIDGSRSNGELSAEGVVIDAAGLRMAYRMKDAAAFQMADVPAARRVELLAASRRLVDSAVQSKAGAEALRNRVIPLGVQGGAGAAGVELSPTLQPYQDDGRRSKYFK